MNKMEYVKGRFAFIFQEKLKDKEKDRSKIRSVFLNDKDKCHIVSEVKKTINEMDLSDIEEILMVLDQEYEYITSNLREKYFNYIFSNEKKSSAKFYFNKNVRFEKKGNVFDVVLGSKNYVFPSKIEPFFNMAFKSDVFCYKDIELFFNKDSAENLIDFFVGENIVFKVQCR